MILQTGSRLSGNEPSHAPAGLHIAAFSSVVVGLGSPALQLRAHTYTAS